MICEYCGNFFLKIKKDCAEHINVAQKIQKHLFCCSKCKEEWILHVQKYPVGKIFSWRIGSNKNCYYFIKKKVIIKYPPYVGTKMKHSYFDILLTEIKL